MNLTTVISEIFSVKTAVIKVPLPSPNYLVHQYHAGMIQLVWCGTIYNEPRHSARASIATNAL